MTSLNSKVAHYNKYAYRYVIQDTIQTIPQNSRLVKTAIEIPVTTLQTNALPKQSI